MCVINLRLAICRVIIGLKSAGCFLFLENGRKHYDLMKIYYYEIAYVFPLDDAPFPDNAM